VARASDDAVAIREEPVIHDGPIRFSAVRAASDNRGHVASVARRDWRTSGAASLQ